ncbi:ComEC/Rec2 family competence protein [Microbacterium sp. ET2]|uniref:ComEC/Rec2 family competence protein n=1 Tax=Microbacterium albipurpureum TaxID=3050384 RepID=UPI00259CBBF8|nr:ComEC/Rec2 family competence protein [Microbacterium sp. ET2 (Ac-2212)]WJL95682.1 ComEC/Rec2 family competence protein [Microbacterium sp. ET2 (Ac-2212)]
MPAAAVIAWIAAAVATLHPQASAAVAGATWTAAALLLVTVVAARASSRGRVSLRRTTGLWFTAVVLGMVTAGVASTSAALSAPSVRDAQERVPAGRSVEAEILVTGKVERHGASEWAFDAVALSLATDEPAAAGVATVAVSVVIADADRRVVPELDVGARVRVSAVAVQPYSGGRAALVLRAGEEPELIRPPTGILAVASDLRSGLVAAVSGLPDPGRTLIPGLAVGDTRLVTADLETAMIASSLSHLTAVSGANCALVVGVAYVLAAALGLRRGARTMVSLVALGGFVVLVTPEPSVVRAGVMAAVAMLAVLLGRSGIGLAVLSLAVMVLLAVDPWLSTSLGFALSVVATGSLLVLAPPLAAGLARLLPAPVALILSVPIAAQLACGPLLVLIQPTVPLYGVIANVLAAPAAPVATIVGLLACLSPVVPLLQSGLAVLAWFPAAWIAAVAETASALPGAESPWVGGIGGLLTLAAAGAALWVLVAVRPRRRGVVGVLRLTSGLVLALTLGIVSGTTALRTLAGPLTLPGAWSVIACDIGQGDAVLIRSAGEVALVDTGPDPVGLSACLDRVGVDRIDLLVLTHFDIDHVGGVDAVIGRVETVIHGPLDGGSAARVLSVLDSGGAVVREVHQGTSGRLGDAAWRTLWPREDSPAFPPGNDASVVLDIHGAGTPRVLLLGDLSAAPQRALVADGVLADSYDLVKVAHHGSADQHVPLYDDVDAAAALITVGRENRHGHPREDILRALAATGTAIARTDEDGLVALWLDDGRLRIFRDTGRAAATGAVGGDR